MKRYKFVHFIYYTEGPPTRRPTESNKVRTSSYPHAPTKFQGLTVLTKSQVSHVRRFCITSGEFGKFL